jgi:hypothetical protein
MRTVVIVVFILMQSSLQAGWRQLKTGDAPAKVSAELGAPLFVNKSRGIEVWIYDRCGTVEFQGNRVTYLQPSQPELKPKAKTVTAVAPKTALAKN